MDERRYTQRSRSAEQDEQIGALIAAVARLERSASDDRTTLRKLDSEVRGLQTIVTDMARLTDEIRGLLIIKNWIKIFAVLIVTTIAGFIAESVRQRERVEMMREQLIEVKENSEMNNRSLNQIGANVRAIDARLGVWMQAEERRVTDLERRTEERGRGKR